MRIRKWNNRTWLIFLGMFVAMFLFAFLTAKFKNDEDVNAANLGNFDAGYIISDYQMSNYNSMSEAEIWNFLKQKGNCNDTRTYLADRYTSYSYHIKDGHFVCLADETFGNGTAYGNNAPYGESAAHIIWQAAQDYRINPQVLIVLLQKEQGLITDSWPNDRQYKTATGYGCPDTAPCNSEYYGFKNQVRKAAALFRTVLDGGWTNYPLGWNYVQYNPSASCGGSWVNIRSLATSALYRYTPYQPNSAALAAGYGSGDSCSAYGNRNFYSYFEDWFGGITINGDSSQRYIKVVYDEHGGERGVLGRQKTGVMMNMETDIRWIQYENGYIVGNDDHGYYISMGKIRDVWASFDFEYGKLGFPVSNIKTNDKTGIIFQQYEHGYIVGNDKYGYYISMGKIRDVWASFDFEYGKLGFPVSNIKTNDKTGIIFQQYEHGYIVGNDKYGYYISMGKIRDVWASFDFEYGKLGFPVSNIKTNDKTGIIFQQYEHGYIVGNDKYGYYISMGKIRDVWASFDFEYGKLGFPVSNIKTNDKTGIIFQQYEHGYIVGNDKYGYYISMGKIRDVWASFDFEYGKLGFPVSNIKTNDKTGIIFQQYEHGYIVGNDKYGYYISMGKIRDVWASFDFEYGKLGFPVSNIKTNDKTGIIFQQYEHGTVYFSDTKDVWVE